MIAGRDIGHSAIANLARRGLVNSPAYIYDLDAVGAIAAHSAYCSREANIQLLYATKACDVPGVLSTLSSFVDGFSCSSLHEACVVADCTAQGKERHWISPIVTASEARSVFSRCTQVTLNSPGQVSLLGDYICRHQNVGLRVNLGTSFVDDYRYDPFSPGSRLGVFRSTIDALTEPERERLLANIKGLHFHSNCDCVDAHPLEEAADALVDQFGELFDSLEWVNVGGGYLPSYWKTWDSLRAAAETIRSRWDCAVLFEPGADFVRNSGFLVSRVCDIVATPTGPVAVLDTTVNHWPEVFEFQFEPDVLGHREDGRYEYTLAGRSCLAGDVFGHYCFDRPLDVGDPVVFSAAGAYSLVKAHSFNGLPLPALYYLVGNELCSSDDFNQFLTNHNHRSHP